LLTLALFSPKNNLLEVSIPFSLIINQMAKPKPRHQIPLEFSWAQPQLSRKKFQFNLGQPETNQIFLNQTKKLEIYTNKNCKHWI
jgi:hypothetical protein